MADAHEVEGRGGVVFRVAGELFFLPASIAMKVIAAPAISRVPGGPPELRGVALVDGDMIPVVDLESTGQETVRRSDRPGLRPGEAMLVCSVLGESMGLVGIEVVETGRFETAGASGEVTTSESGVARTFDVAATIARVREGRWAV